MGDTTVEDWIDQVYEPFRQRVRRDLFMTLAIFCYQSRPIDGYYLEFGCHKARTFRLAWDAFGVLFDWTFVAFDSFQGLPEVSIEDSAEIWGTGTLATSEEDFVRLVTEHGLPRDRLITVPGFFEQSLTPRLRDRLLPTRAAVVYIDCDLYASTVPVLEFVRPLLQRGTVIVFDDWYCFCADPDRGEQRAFREFRERYPDLRFAEFPSTNLARCFVFLGDGSDPTTPAGLAHS